MYNIILASASPRRKEILEQIGISFTAAASKVEEVLEEDKYDAGRFAEELALMKAQDVAQRMTPGSLVIGADTVVLSESGILGKPKDKEDAFIMLKSLEGKTHSVLTGVALVEAPEGKYMVSHEVTEVRFRHLTDKEIKSYIDSGEPMDKAGAYGIQGKGALFVEGIVGCYFNVVGLPVSRLSLMMRDFGIEILG